MLTRVLIANRGEIAIRIARAAAALGMESVAVYAPVDARSLHTRCATDAHEIGPGEPGNAVGAYLDARIFRFSQIQASASCRKPRQRGRMGRSRWPRAATP